MVYRHHALRLVVGCNLAYTSADLIGLAVLGHTLIYHSKGIFEVGMHRSISFQHIFGVQHADHTVGNLRPLDPNAIFRVGELLSIVVSGNLAQEAVFRLLVDSNEFLDIVATDVAFTDS